jgi:hypothetical protein
LGAAAPRLFAALICSLVMAMNCLPVSKASIAQLDRILSRWIDGTGL